MSTKHILDFYAAPGPLTDVEAHKDHIAQLPSDIGELARIVHGLVIHQFLAEPFYGVKLPGDRAKEMHIRPVRAMLDVVQSLDARPFDKARPPEKRFAGICRNFGTIMVALLRAKGVPVRSRYGFARYFNPPYIEDHHVCEYWNNEQKRWILVDAQLAGEEWKKNLGFTFDPLDVPRDQFLVPGDAWLQSRSGKADPAKIGSFNGNMYGLWFNAGAIIRDVAALNKMEMLQWDVWGAQPQPGAEITEEQLAFFDNLAELALSSDESFDKLRDLYNKDDRLHVPKTVFNAVLSRTEEVAIEYNQTR